MPLHNRPLLRNAEIGEVNKIQQVDDRYQDIVFNPVMLDFPADHYTNVRNECGGKKKQEVNVKEGIILICTVKILFSKKQQVGKYQKRQQVQQITNLKQNGCAPPSLVIPERL